MDKRLTVLLAEVFRLRENEIHPGLKKADVGSWDSLKQMDLVISLENEYGIVLAIPEIHRKNPIGGNKKVLIEKGVTLAD